MSRRPLNRTRPGEALEIALNLWRRGRGAVRRTPGLLMLSFLIGTVLWFFVTETENPTRVDLFPASITVEAVNVASSLAVANNLGSVQVRVAAAEDRWERLTSANFRAFVDLNGIGAREQRVPVTVDVDGISGVRVVEVIPGTVVVNLEDFVTREVPVVTRMVGTVPLGYEVVGTTPARASVEVFGPSSLVSLVEEAVADVNVTGLTVPLEQVVDLIPRAGGGGDIRGVRLDPPSVAISIEVTQTTLVRTLPLEATIVGEPARGYRVTSVEASPSTATVHGTIEALQTLQTLQLSPVDIGGATEGPLSERAEIQLPPGVTLAEPVTSTVNVNVAAIEGSLLLSVAPRAVGVEEGLTARFEHSQVIVQLQGPQPLLNAITAADVSVTVDVSGRGEGTVMLPVSVQVPDRIAVVAVQPASLSVTLEAPR